MTKITITALLIATAATSTQAQEHPPYSRTFTALTGGSPHTGLLLTLSCSAGAWTAHMAPPAGHDARLPPGPALVLPLWSQSTDPPYLPAEIAGGEVTVSNAGPMAAELLIERGWLSRLTRFFGADMFVLDILSRSRDNLLSATFDLEPLRRHVQAAPAACNNNAAASRNQQAPRRPADSAIDFGDDTSEWSHDAECDDPRFEGPGMGWLLMNEDRGRDATDCRQLFESGRIRLKQNER